MATGGDASAKGTSPLDESVTFLFTDVEGSTALWEERPDEMEVALAEHDRRLRAAIAANGGYIFTTAGDSFAVAFASADKACAAAIDAQQMLLEPCGSIAIRVRMALHTGVASQRDGDYFGAVVNRAARLMSAAHGGQLLLSRATESRLSGSPSAEIELVDRGEHRLKDLLDPERIFEVRHTALPNDFPALRTLDAVANGLPAQLSELIGRDRELREVRELLDECRLVTLMGSGGAGKTRLALHAAAEGIDDYPAGIRLVELAGLIDPAVVVDEIAERVGAQPGPNVDAVEAIAERIGGLHMLLVLDNCEHLIKVVAEVVAVLLRSCHQLRILATSQVALGVQSEFRYRVPSLETADTDNLEVVASSAAARLFVDRARAVDAGFKLDESNASAVSAICRRLDGIPLAIELAAARVGVLGPQQIADRLDVRFNLLGGGTRDAAPRHRTLRATMDWSYDLLSKEEQALLRRESVFAGAFDLEAVEHVAIAPPSIEPVDVLDLQAALVDKSFVTTESAGPKSRYRLLESVRAYGRERFRESGEEDDAGTQHALHHVTLAKQLLDRQRAGDAQGALQGLDRHEDDFRAALRFLLDRDETEPAAEIIAALGFLWYLTGAFREGVDWCRELFDQDLELPDPVLAGVFHVSATLLGSWVHPAEGLEMIEREVEIRRRIGDDARLAPALNNLGNLLSDLGRSSEAEVALREAISSFGALGDSAALSYCTLGSLAFDDGRLEEATKLYATACAEASEYGDVYAIALAQSFMAWCSVLRGRTADAWSLLEPARATMLDLGVRPGVGQLDLIEGQAHLADGDTARAAASLLAALVDPDAHWYPTAPLWAVQLGVLLIDDHARAAELVGAVDRQYTDAGTSQPAWVHEHLDMLRSDLVRNLGATEFARALTKGSRMSRADTIAAGREHLSTVAAAPGDRPATTDA